MVTTDSYQCKFGFLIKNLPTFSIQDLYDLLLQRVDRVIGGAVMSLDMCLLLTLARIFPGLGPDPPS